MKQTCFLSKQNDSPGSFRHDIRLGNRQLALSWSILAEPLESILFFIFLSWPEIQAHAAVVPALP